MRASFGDKAGYRLHYMIDVGIAHSEVERQSDKGVGRLFGHWALASLTAKAATDVREIEGLIVEDRVNVIALKRLDEAAAIVTRPQA